MYYRKLYPYQATVGIYVGWDDRIKYKKEMEEQGLVKDDQPLLWHKGINLYDENKPFEVDVFGSGCVLFKKEVFEKIPQPYYKYIHDPWKGKYLNVSEDMFICAQLKKYGFKALCNPKVQCEHMIMMRVNKDHHKRSIDLELKKLSEDAYEKQVKELIDVR
jgi:GT2 family glycosyltransferase